MPLRHIQTIGRVASLAVSIACLSWSPSAQGQPAADVDAARELFKQASQASKDGRWEEARDKFTRSLSLKSAPITHFSLAVAQKHTRDYVEALENFRAFLVSAPNPATDAYREPAATAVKELEGLVGRVTIHVEPKDAPALRVTVDGVVVPAVALDQSRLVNPGEHVVIANAAGHHEASKVVSVESGQSAELHLQLEVAPVEARPIEERPATQTSGDTTAPSSPFPLGPVLLMGGGGLTFVAGLAVGLVGLQEAKDAPADDTPEADAARTKGLAGDIVAGVGIAAVAGGLIWLLIPSDDEPVDDTVALRPWVSNELAGVELRF